jgi:addiction module RelE/StbE family toxin
VKLIYSERAVSDLARLRDFISQYNPSAAARIADELVTKVLHLRRFPLIGRLVDESPEPRQIRDLVVSDYIVRYLPTDNAIIVLRIWHHREHRSSGG